MFLEHTSKMLGIFKTEEVGGLADRLAVPEIGFGFLHHEVADENHGRLASGLPDEVTEIIG